VGAALGELYARDKLTLSQSIESELTAQLALPTVYRLCLVTARALRTTDDSSLALRQQARSPTFLLNVLALAFLHPMGPQGLIQDLTTARPQTDEPEQVTCAIAVVQTLYWLQYNPPAPVLLSALQQSPALQNTSLAARLSDVCQQLVDRKNVHLETQQAVEAWTSDSVIAQVLYSLVTTPEDFRLIVQRATRLLAHQPDGVILAAALAGFHGGLSALPLPWRFKLKTVHWSVAMPLEEGLCTFANLCAARWAGYYGTQPLADEAMAIAPPGQLRPR
jgi:hypothetical protein